MCHRLEGRTALVTGAAGGIGACVARLFAAEGARVLLTDVVDESGRRTAEEIGTAAGYQRLDVADEGAWATAVAFAEEWFGSVDVLINNAAVHALGSIEEMPVAVYERLVSVNQIGPWLGMKAVLPAMRRAGGGAIVNVSSGAGLRGISGMSAYAATKWAVRGMTKSAAIEFAHYGIRVNSVHPGPIRTPMIGDMLEAATAQAEQAPLGRLGEPEEIAKLILFAASDESGFSTGGEFVADGGASAG